MRLNVESRTSFSGRGAAGLKFWGDSRKFGGFPNKDGLCYNTRNRLGELLSRMVL